MKRVFLLMVVSALLATLGFAQTPGVGSTTDLASVQGCLGGTDGNYTVAEDGTRQIFKVTTSSVDLKAHLGHEVKLIGHKGAVNAGAADNSFAVAELNMISEHCAAAAAAPVVSAISPSETVIAPVATATAPSAIPSTPVVDAAAPVATVSPSSATASTPAVVVVAPAATVTPSASTPALVVVAPVTPSASTPAVVVVAPATTASPSSTPAVDAAAPVATVSTSSETAITPAVDAAPPRRVPAHARKSSATKAATATAPATKAIPSPETASPSAADTVIPTATVSPSPEIASTPAAAAPTAPPVTHRSSGLWLMIAIAVLVIVIGTLTPLLSRWRKRKMLERAGTQNLSFTNESSSDPEKEEPRKAA